MIKTLHPYFKMDDLIFDICRHSFAGPTRVGLHDHSYIEILVCLNGQCRHIVNGVSNTFGYGDVFVMHPGWSHDLEVEDSFDHLTLACTSFAPGLLTPELRENEYFKRLFDTRHAIPTGIHLSLEEYSVIKGLAKTTLLEFSGKKLGWRAIIRANFATVITMFCRFYSQQSSDSGIVTCLQEIIEYMHAHFQQNIKLRDLAKRVGMSECYMLRLFRKTYGDTPINYLIKLRIDHAKKLLLLQDNDLSIMEIAFASGFNDSNYFCRQFKKIAGLSPLQYKRLH